LGNGEDPNSSDTNPRSVKAKEKEVFLGHLSELSNTCPKVSDTDACWTM
jgi:hypothetical protein